jgi:hypothetical protein
MSVMLQSSFSLSNLLCNVDNSNGGSLVAGVHSLDSLKKEQSYLEVSIGDTQEHQLSVYPEKESLCFNITQTTCQATTKKLTPLHNCIVH